MALPPDHDHTYTLQPINQINDRPLFANPISKATFQALPKIYGRTKKKKYTPKLTQQTRQPTQTDTKIAYHTHRLSLIQRYQINKTQVDLNTSRELISEKRVKTQMKSFDKKYANELSQPRKEYCNKKSCYCKIDCRTEHNACTQKLPVKLQSIKRLKLPDIQGSHELQQKESKHKVLLGTIDRKQESSFRKPFRLLDLLKSSEKKYKPIIQENSQPQTPINRSGRKVNRKEVEIQFPMKMENAGVQTERQHQIIDEDDVKGKTQPIEKKFSKKTDRKVQSSNSNRTHLKINQMNDNFKQKNQFEDQQANKGKLKFQQLRAQQTENLIIDSQLDDNRSVKSSLSSASLSKHVFQSSKQTNTMFQSLKKKQTSSIKQKNTNREIKSKQSNKFIYQKKNGLFIIPQQDQYVSYLKDYQPMNQKFHIKNLIRKQDFKIVKDEEAVYFGEFKDQMKNGKGILVTDKTIFQGQYQNNIKTYGCEKNIDGVYKGQFVNGTRQGYGTFEWNNGQIFQGEWKNGTKNGYGIWKSPRGDYYQGGWKLNRQHGKGIYKHKISTYRGHFVQFLKDGQGEQLFVNGDKYVGNYSKGKPNGFGKYIWADGSYYQGQFCNGVRQGKGKWVYNNGTVYEGEFKNDFKQGYGRQVYKSGEYFNGIFLKGVRQQGSLFDSRGGEIKIILSE